MPGPLGFYEVQLQTKGPADKVFGSLGFFFREGAELGASPGIIKCKLTQTQ